MDVLPQLFPSPLHITTHTETREQGLKKHSKLGRSRSGEARGETKQPYLDFKRICILMTTRL